MKLSIRSTLIVSIVMIFGSKTTNADRMIRAVFNNGTAATTETFCSSSDNAHIDKVFQPIKERYLRKITTATDAAVVDELDDYTFFGDYGMVEPNKDVDRKLYPQYCKQHCAGYVTGTCRATNCVGYRRQLQNLKCSDHIQLVNTELDEVMKKVSSTCAAFLEPKHRHVECYDDVIYGVVENFVLWKSKKFDRNYHIATPGSKEIDPMEMSYTMVNNLKSFGVVTDGFTICHYDRINIEAVVNPCVKYINSTLSNPNGFSVNRYEGDIPYTVFGDNKNTPMGRELPVVGTYTFTALPDGFEHKKASISFNVVRC